MHPRLVERSDDGREACEDWLRTVEWSGANRSARYLEELALYFVNIQTGKIGG